MTVSGSIRDDFIKMVIISLFFRIGDSYEIQNRRRGPRTHIHLRVWRKDRRG